MIINKNKKMVSIIMLFLMIFSFMVDFGITVHASDNLTVSMIDISNKDKRPNENFYRINRSKEKAKIQLNIRNTNNINSGSIILVPTYKNYDPVDLDVDTIVQNPNFDYSDVDLTDFDTLGFTVTSNNEVSNKVKLPVHKSTKTLLNTFEKNNKTVIELVDGEVIDVRNSDLAILPLKDIGISSGNINLELSFRNPGLIEDGRDVEVNLLYSENGFKGPYKKLDESINYKIENKHVASSYNPYMNRVPVYKNNFTGNYSDYYNFGENGPKIEQIFNAGALDKNNNLIKGSEYFQPIPPMIMNHQIESRTLSEIKYFVEIPKYEDNDGNIREAEVDFSKDKQIVQIMKPNNSAERILLETQWSGKVKLNGMLGHYLIIRPAEKEYLRSYDLRTNDFQRSFDITILRSASNEYQNNFSYIYRENPINVKFPNAKPGQMIELRRGFNSIPRKSNKYDKKNSIYQSSVNKSTAGYGYITKNSHSSEEYLNGRNVQFSKSTPTSNLNVRNYVKPSPKLSKQIRLGEKLTTFEYDRNNLYPVISTFHKNFEGGGIIQPVHTRDEKGKLVSRNDDQSIVNKVRIGTIFNKEYGTSDTEKNIDIKFVNLFRAKGFEYISSAVHNYNDDVIYFNKESDKSTLDQIFDYDIIFRDKSGEEIFRRSVSKNDHFVEHNNSVVDISKEVQKHNPFEVLLEVSSKNVSSPENLISVSYVDIKDTKVNPVNNKVTYVDTDILYEMDYMVNNQEFTVQEVADQLISFREPENKISLIHYFKKTGTDDLSGYSDNEDLVGGPINTSTLDKVFPTMFFGLRGIQSKDEELKNFKYVVLMPIGIKNKNLSMLSGTSNLENYFNISIIDNYAGTKRTAVEIKPKALGGKIKPSQTEFNLSMAIGELTGESLIGVDKDDLKFETMISFDGVEDYKVIHAQNLNELDIIKLDKYNISDGSNSKIVKMDHNVSYLSDNLVSISKSVDLQENSKGEKKSDVEVHIPNDEKAVFTLTVKNNSGSQLKNIDLYDILPGINDKNLILSIPRYSTNSFNDFSILKNEDYNKFNIRYAEGNYSNMSNFDDLNKLTYTTNKTSNSNILKFQIPVIEIGEEINIKIAADLSGKEYDGGEYMHNSFILDMNNINDFKPIESNIASVMINDNYKGRVALRKTDTKNNYVEDAVFEIKNVNTNKVYKWITKSNQDNMYVSLPYGDYEMREIKAPEGYLLNSEVKSFSIPSKTTNKIETIKFINLKLKDFKIKKIDENTGEPIEGVKFDVYNKSNDKVISTVTTNSSGEAIIKDLIENEEYYVKEVYAPKEYIYDENKVYDIDLDLNELIITNKHFLGTRTIYHYQKKSNGELELIIDPIKRKDIIFNTPYSEEPLDSENPKFSNYKLIEMPNNAKGYQDKEHIDVKFYYEYIDPNYEVEVIKLDGRSKTPLKPNGDNDKRAEISLYEKDGDSLILIESKLTNDDAKVLFTDLSPSKTYIVKETKAPKGYSINKTEHPISKDNNLINIVNYKTNEVPKTGTHGKILFFILGSLLLSTFIVLKED